MFAIVLDVKRRVGIDLPNPFFGLIQNTNTKNGDVTGEVASYFYQSIRNRLPIDST